MQTHPERGSSYGGRGTDTRGSQGDLPNNAVAKKVISCVGANTSIYANIPRPKMITYTPVMILCLFVTVNRGSRHISTSLRRRLSKLHLA
jgi:hypothetical protein